MAKDALTEPTNGEVLSRLTQVMELLASKPDTTSAQMGSINDTIAATLTKLSEQFAQQNARHMLPSNAQNMGADGNGAKSFYRPKGDLHPDYLSLKWHRQPWYNGNKVQLGDVNPEEIQTYNELSQLLPAHTSRRTARDGRWKAWIGENNSDMYLSVPSKSIEDQMNTPATLVFVLREFIDGKAVDPASLYSELAVLKAQLEAALAQNKAAHP